MSQIDSPGSRALRRGRVSRAGGVYFVTTHTRGREPVFREFLAACAAAVAITDRVSLGDSRLLVWVLMPDHLHVLLQLGDRDSLPLVVGRLKARSSTAVKQTTKCRQGVWESGYHDRALRCEDDLRAIARYIVANPIRAGLVRSCHAYSFWDAIWL